MATGAIVVAATPIGNVDDASPRLRHLLAAADVIAAEDTRRVRRLAGRLGVRISGRIVSHHEHNETERLAELLGVARGGGTVLVVSDAGMPTVSDPGFALVRAAVSGGVRVSVVPGPSAVLAALAVSGLPTDRFCFEGFLPRRVGERVQAVRALVDERRTMVFFEAPQRLPAALAVLSAELGADRPAAVCRELTKTHEETVRGTLAELSAWAGEQQVRGELVVVVGGAVRVMPPVGALVPEVLARVAAGERLKEAVAAVAGATGVSRRELYAAALAGRSG